MINDEKIKKVLSKNLKDARLKIGMTQDTLAEKSNLSTQFVREIESGNNIGSVPTLINLCTALKTTPNKILYDLFKDKEKSDENLLFKINNLSERDKNIIITLIDYMSNNNV